MVEIQVFSPSKPAQKFLYGNVNKMQMSVLETLVDRIEERRRSRDSAAETEAGGRGSGGGGRGSGKGSAIGTGRWSGVCGRTIEELEEEEREENKLLLKKIDMKLESAARDKRQRPISTANTHWNSMGEAALQHRNNQTKKIELGRSTVAECPKRFQ